MPVTLVSVLLFMALSGPSCLQGSSDPQDTPVVDRTEARLADLERQNGAIKVHISSLESTNNALEIQVNALENKNNVLENKSDALETQVNVLEKENNALQTQVNVLEKENNVLLTEVDVLKTKNRALKDLSAKRVSFHARTWDDIRLKPNSTIILPTIVINQGDAYNSTSGVFTAPFHGTYCLMASTQTFNFYDQASLSLMVDNTEMGYVYNYYNTTDESGSVSATVHLKAGQTAWLKSGPGIENWYYFLATKFTGFLISPNP